MDPLALSSTICNFLPCSNKEGALLAAIFLYWNYMIFILKVNLTAKQKRWGFFTYLITILCLLDFRMVCCFPLRLWALWHSCWFLGLYNKCSWFISVSPQVIPGLQVLFSWYQVRHTPQLTASQQRTVSWGLEHHLSTWRTNSEYTPLLWQWKKAGLELFCKNKKTGSWNLPT